VVVTDLPAARPGQPGSSSSSSSATPAGGQGVVGRVRTADEIRQAYGRPAQRQSHQVSGRGGARDASLHVHRHAVKQQRDSSAAASASEPVQADSSDKLPYLVLCFLAEKPAAAEAMAECDELHGS